MKASTKTRASGGHRELAGQYDFHVHWSPEDGEYVAVAREWPSLSWLASDRTAALEGLVRAIEDVLEDMAETGETPPEPLSRRTYSGEVRLRMPKELHRSLAWQADQEGVSLNTLMVSRLARALPVVAEVEFDGKL